VLGAKKRVATALWCGRRICRIFLHGKPQKPSVSLFENRHLIGDLRVKNVYDGANDPPLKCEAPTFCFTPFLQGMCLAHGEKA
jgi:hypothetical protein